MMMIRSGAPLPLPAVLAMALLMALPACAPLVRVSPLGELALPSSDQTSVVLAADGSVLAELHAEQDRDPVPLDAVSTVLQDAVVAVEDARFWGHRGIDVRAVARAVVENTRVGRAVEGGSTITQQLAKNLVVGHEPTADRKLREAAVALRIEAQHSKEEILERYLNTVYFGSGAYGVQAASRRYFGVDAAEVTLPQAALLAGLLRAPSRYDPHSAPDAALRRRDVVLRLLAERGVASREEVHDALQAPLGVGSGEPAKWRAPYFVAHVLALLQHDSEFAALGPDPAARAHEVFRGGLTIETGLDPHWQEAAEAAVAATLPDPDDPRAALVAIDPATGEIRALVGGRDYDADDDPSARFNLAVDGRRQPGSAFKPIVLAAALAAGNTLDERFDGAASVMLNLEGNRGWTVRNYGDRNHGWVSLLEATVQSVNVVYARLINRLGPQAVAPLARDLGIGRPLVPVHSLALGAVEVSPLELASVQATLAAGGVHRAATAVRRVVAADGTPLYERPPDPGVRVLDEDVARLVTAALREVVTRGTGVRADIGRPMAGKTGTAQDWRDAWFAGFTPDLAAAVWVGFPDAQEAMTPPRTRIRVEGGTWPSEIFARFGLRALEGVPANDFVLPALPPRPASVEVPDVLRAPVATAEQSLGDLGFVARVLPQFSSAAPPGYVLRQDPPADTMALVGDVVTLWVSSADRTLQTVPDVLGLPLVDARAALEVAGFVVLVERGCPGGATECSGARLRPGRVWEQSPDSGANVPVHSPVTLRAYP